MGGGHGGAPVARVLGRVGGYWWGSGATCWAEGTAPPPAGPKKNPELDKKRGAKSCAPFPAPSPRLVVAPGRGVTPPPQCHPRVPGWVLAAGGTLPPARRVTSLSCPPKMSPVGTPNPTGINYPAPQCPELGCAQDLAQPSPIFGCPPPIRRSFQGAGTPPGPKSMAQAGDQEQGGSPSIPSKALGEPRALLPARIWLQNLQKTTSNPPGHGRRSCGG